ncbi:hypothetical protein HPB47_013527 [Ixodes persulcatus]|uniref:Uncharacterized protein n=1 Tax=Ixodes persulcatus TaxID=34615 RepID=A0AC60QYA0_IXOPE|nr:hypothetical protein HPB47_013527 [Ixodes persulcatus]
MYALVRFLKDQDNRRHVLPVRKIRNFAPQHKMDFDNKAVYTVYWEDDVNSENTGDYSAQILMLGVSEEEVRECPKRVPVPKVTVDESSEDETSTQKKNKQAAKKKKSNQAAAKKDSYEAILRNQMSQAHQKNSGIGSFTQKRQRASDTSDSDDSLVSSSELQEARKKTKYWKARCKELREDNVFLQEQVRAQQALLGSKLIRRRWRRRREPYGQCAIAQQLCFPPSDHGVWTNSLNNLPQLSNQTLGGLCTLATTSSKQRTKSYAFAAEAYTLPVVASVCTGLQKY